MVLFSLINTALLTFTMIGFGWIFIRRPPKDINSVYGYRTRMSSINEDTWAFAHYYSGRIWIRSGIITLALSLPFIVALRKLEEYENYMMILFYIQMAVLLAVIPITERSLKKTFDRDGARR